MICTFGCRCNQADSAAVRESLCRASLQETDSHLDADLIVVNTCTVTHRADQQARQAIHKFHRENPKARMIVAGCYAERNPEGLAHIPGVDLVVGNGCREQIAVLAKDDKGAGTGKIVHCPLPPEDDYRILPLAQSGHKTRPFVKVQDGCEGRCSYCIVPRVRGPERSARAVDVLEEIRRLVERGFQEIVLTGVNLGAYGRKSVDSMRLVDLLRQILTIPYLGRLRLSSVEMMYFDRDIIRLAADNPVLAPHFHIPMQSGSEVILRRMHRPSTPQQFLELLHYAREILPGAGLGTDILVGFPGETDEDFERTCELVRNSPLTYLHVFPFSPREGTEAFSLPDRIPAAEVQKRARRLREIARDKNLAFRRRFIGQVLPGITLAEDERERASEALTENYIHVRIDAGAVSANRLVRVRVKEVSVGATRAALEGY